MSMEGPTGVPLWSDNWGVWYYDALVCTECSRTARAGGCGMPTCPLLKFRGAGLPARKSWESNHPVPLR